MFQFIKHRKFCEKEPSQDTYKYATQFCVFLKTWKSINEIITEKVKPNPCASDQMALRHNQAVWVGKIFIEFNLQENKEHHQ